MKKTLSILSASYLISIGVTTTAITPAHAAESDNYLQLSWSKDSGFVNDLPGSFVGSDSVGDSAGKIDSIVPGDKDSRTVYVKNNSPSKAILKGWIIDVNTYNPETPDQCPGKPGSIIDWEGSTATCPTVGSQGNFYNDVKLSWNGLQSDSKNFTTLQAAPDQTTSMGEKELQPGEVVPVTIGYDFPLESTSGNYANVGKRMASFNVKFELQGEDAITPPTVEIPVDKVEAGTKDPVKIPVIPGVGTDQNPTMSLICTIKDSNPAQPVNYFTLVRDEKTGEYYIADFVENGVFQKVAGTYVCTVSIKDQWGEETDSSDSVEITVVEPTPTPTPTVTTTVTAPPVTSTITAPPVTNTVTQPPTTSTVTITASPSPTPTITVTVTPKSTPTNTSTTAPKPTVKVSRRTPQPTVEVSRNTSTTSSITDNSKNTSTPTVEKDTSTVSRNPVYRGSIPTTSSSNSSKNNTNNNNSNNSTRIVEGYDNKTENPYKNKSNLDDSATVGKVTKEACHGRTNIQKTDPEYSEALDKNKNGVACEKDIDVDSGEAFNQASPVMIALGALTSMIGACLIGVGLKRSSSRKES